MSDKTSKQEDGVAERCVNHRPRALLLLTIIKMAGMVISAILCTFAIGADRYCLTISGRTR